MAKRRGPPSQGWRTFLRNHADGIAAMDLFVVPTLPAFLAELIFWPYGIKAPPHLVEPARR
jgi:hypothetical protein